MFRPMLAADATDDLGALRFPMFASPKLDGIRCVIVNGKPMSRKLKPIPNAYVREQLAGLPPFDGELMLWRKDTTFNDVQSEIMSREGQPDFFYHVFDNFAVPWSFKDRQAWLLEWFGGLKIGDDSEPLQLVKQTLIRTLEELARYEQKAVMKGYEGIMLRDPGGPYKQGRSTFNEGYLLKLKRMADAEGVIVGFEEQLENTNPKTVNKLGKSERSSHKIGMRGKDTLGVLLVKCSKWPGATLRVGTGVGLTAALRDEIWRHRARYGGKIITFSYQAVGTKDRPRIPIFKGFRHGDDR